MVLLGIGVPSWFAQLFKFWKDEHKILGLQAALPHCWLPTAGSSHLLMPIMSTLGVEEVHSELTWFPQTAQPRDASLHSQIH